MNSHLMATQNLVISFDYSLFLAKNLAYAECPIIKFHYRNSSSQWSWLLEIGGEGLIDPAPCFVTYTYVATKPAKPSPSNCLGSLFAPWIFRPSFGPENSIIKSCKKLKVTHVSQNMYLHPKKHLFKNNFVWFLAQMRTRKFAFEI